MNTIAGNSGDSIEALLKAWLPSRRWFGGKGRALRGVSIASQTPLPGEHDVRVTVVDVGFDDGGRDSYQVILGRQDGEVDHRLAHAVIGTVDGQSVYDAVYDHAAMATLLGLLSEGKPVGDLTFTSGGSIDASLTSRVMSAEQSNTSVVFGDQLILKLFRRLQPGANPDIEVTKALADAGSTHVATPIAWVDGEVQSQLTTLGLLQVFLKGASDGWSMATASVRDLFAEGDLHADEVGGDFAGEAERLGVATAEVHALMARTLPAGSADAAECRATAQQLHERLAAAREAVPELAPYGDLLTAAYSEVAALSGPVPIQRIHGDYHLGQVVRTGEGWVLLDFEGEPARPLAERTALMSPLRDVAGMLRSFDYAARHLLAERRGEPQLAYRTGEWAERNRQAFCDGYARAAGSDPRSESVLLRAFELDKAVYEVVYEARNRPGWIAIPLDSIARILSATS